LHREKVKAGGWIGEAVGGASLSLTTPTKRKEMFRPTPQKMVGLCYVTPVTGHEAYTGKEEEEENLGPGMKSFWIEDCCLLGCSTV
jgi:hypothetical protein